MCLFESTMFKQVVYHPDESQLLTAGSDRKITYWDCYDGQAIRMLDGSDTHELNALAIFGQGEHFISSGNDKVIKLWDYDEGINYYKGVGHSGDVTKIAISPDQKFIVTAGSEGAIFIWNTPAAVQKTRADDDMPENTGDALNTMETGGPRPANAPQ